MLAALLAYWAGRSSGRRQGRAEALRRPRDLTGQDVALLRVCGVVVAVCALVVALAA